MRAGMQRGAVATMSLFLPSEAAKEVHGVFLLGMSAGKHEQSRYRDWIMNK